MHLDFAELDKIYDAGRTTVYGGLTLPGGRKAVVKTIRDAFPEAFQAALHIQSVLELRLGVQITDDELSYLTLHVARLTTE